MRQILTLGRSGAAVGTAVAVAMLLSSCGDDSGASSPAPDDERPSVVVTTNVLGDLVRQVAGDLAAVEVIMPLGADPHDFAPSTRQAETMERADLLVVNGAGFEEGMTGVIDAVTDGGTPVFAFADAIDVLEGSHAHEEHADEAHAEDEHADEAHAEDEHADEAHAEDEHADEAHAEGAIDPHVWTDPARMAVAVEALGEALAQVEGIDTAALEPQVDEVVAELTALDAELEEQLAAIPTEARVLVTNHEVFGYFADRYGFEVVGAVVPSLTTDAEASAREIEELAALMREEGITSIFAETTQSTDLADALAEEVGGEVQVVELYAESLGEPGSGADTYVGMMRTNVERIVGALGAG